MPTYKSIPDSYTITTPTFTVAGNLVVTGNSTTITSTNTNIFDNIIVLNAGLGPTTAPTLNAGLTVDRGNQPNVAIQWTESIGAWQLSNDGSTYGNVIVATSTGAITIPGNLLLRNQTVAPSATAGHNTVFAQVPDAGGSGLYVSNANYANVELATKQRSIAYSIIF